MEAIFEKLRKNGYRITLQRQHIIATLTKTPQSVSEIATDLVKKDYSTDIVTVYRTLECFASLGIVSKTLVGGTIMKYELIGGSGHHHHVMCDACGRVEDIPLDEKSLLERVSKQTDFRITSHALEFFGLCVRCQ